MRYVTLIAFLFLVGCSGTNPVPVAPKEIDINLNEIRKHITYTKLEVKPMNEKETISYIGSLYTLIDKLNAKSDMLIDTLENILGKKNESN